MNVGPIIVTVAVLTIMSLYPFYLKKYKPHRYKGIWKSIGDITKTPSRAILYPVGFLIGGILYIMFIQ